MVQAERAKKKNVMPLARVRTVGRQNVSLKCRVRDNFYRERAKRVYLVGRLSMTGDKSNTATELGRSVWRDTLKDAIAHNHLSELPSWICPVGVVQLELPSWICLVGFAQLGLPSWGCPVRFAQLGLPSWGCPVRFAQLDLPSWSCSVGIA